MKKISFIGALCSLAFFACGQGKSREATLNLGFEKMDPSTGIAENWIQKGKDCTIKIDTVEKHSGNASMMIESQGGTERPFGYCMYSIPAVYEGRQIEVKAYMKLQDVKGGFVGILLRLDGEGGMLKMENMKKSNIQGTRDWALYSVSLPLPENATAIQIGGMLTGTGKLWADDFEVLIDGKKIEKADYKKPSKYKADLDTQFNMGSSVAVIPLDSRRINDLILLGKVWGYVKYFHPALSTGDYNWDYELFRILPKVIHCQNDGERNEILLTWISKLGKVTPEKGKQHDSGEVKVYPDIKWIDDVGVLGGRLSALLNDLKNARRKNESYYVGLERSRNPDLKNEKVYAAMHFPDAGFRLLTLYRYWNIIQYLFPYKYLIEENWNNVLAEFIPKMVNAANELEYKLAVLALIAKIHDTHANIWSYDAVLENYRGHYYAPLEITFVENKAVVTDYLHKELGPQTGIQKGDIIISINGKSTDSIIKERLPFTPASNYPTQLRDIALNFLRTGDTVINIAYQHANTIHTAKLTCYAPEKVNVYKNYRSRDTCFRYVAPDIAYIYPGTIRNTYLQNVMPEFLKTKGLIIDLRCYPSDNMFPVLARYILPMPTKFARLTNIYPQVPGLFVFDRYSEVGVKNLQSYKGRVVIIVNERTQSSAEFSTMALRVAPNAMVIGSTTAAADGNVSTFFLPGGIKTAMSGIGVYYPDGRETQRIGIVPDHIIRPTIKGIVEGRDELLEKAIAIINER